MRITITDFDFEKAGYNGGFQDTKECQDNMVNFIQDNYFNGADNAVIYICEYYINEGDYYEFEFELMPN